MSGNIKRAVAAIETELKHAMQAKVHYERQVNSLQAALKELDGLDAPALIAGPKGKRGRKAKSVGG